MRFRVLDGGSAEDLAGWLARWQAWPLREIQGHPAYAGLFARPCDRVVCAVGDGARGGILFPLLLRPISEEPWAPAGEERVDAITPYGYGGPFAWGVDPHEVDAFWAAHRAWCDRRRIVSTFARLSLFPDQLAPIPGRVEVRAPNVVVPLEGGPEALWRGYDTRVRRWVRVAERAGLEVELDREGARLDAFLALYEHTMRRNEADAWYFFPRSFFEKIREQLRGHFAFFHALRGGEVVSSDLVLCSEEHVYYFLGGTRAEAFPLGPSYLVKHRIATWAAACGKRGYVLGGGYAPDDGLLRYKRGFARGDVPFRVACLVHDERGYWDLVRARAENASRAGRPWSPAPDFFPAYRT